MAARKKAFYILPGAYSMIGIGTIFRRRTGSGGPLPPDYAKWVKEHMVFWYDMSKPVDVYTQNFNDWQNYNPNSVSITNNKIVVNGLIDNFRIASIGKETESFSVFIEGLGDKNLVYRVKLDENSDQITNIKLKDGENVLPHSFTTTVAFMGVSGVTDYIGLTITQLPSGQSVPTNEILKANPYLQDFSGNNRPLKLNNFLFAAMSGVGGYSLNAKSYHNRLGTLEGTFNDYSVVITAKVKDILGLVWTENGTGEHISVAVGKSFTRPAFTVTVEGMPDNLKWGLYEDNAPAKKGNGTFEIPAYTYTNTTETVQYRFIGFTFNKNKFDNVNIKFTFQPLYPNSLVTDGVDDYGVVENFKSLQNYMMFFQCAIIRPNAVNGMFSTTPVESVVQGWMLLQGQSANSVRFGNYAYKNFEFTSSIKDKISYVLSANNELMTCYVGEEKATLAGTYRQTGANMSLFLSNPVGKNRFGSMAFYKSILFDSVPTKETDGFTEQDLIDYVLENIITQ